MAACVAQLPSHSVMEQQHNSAAMPFQQPAYYVGIPHAPPAGLMPPPQFAYSQLQRPPQVSRPQPQQQQQQQFNQGLARPQPQQQQQFKGLQPRRKQKRKQRWHGQHKGRQQESAPGQMLNRMRARQHFGNDTPRTVPHAPLNDNNFILEQHRRLSTDGAQLDSPAMTPGHSFANADYSNLGKDAADLGAQLDFFGTNEGLVARYSSEDDTSEGEGNDSEEDGDLHGWHLRLDQEDDSLKGLPSHVRVRLADQSAYIQQLEQENLDLQEKYTLLKHEMEEMRAAARAPLPAGAATQEPATAIQAQTSSAQPADAEDVHND